MTEGIYIGRGADSEAEQEFANRTVTPHWRIIQSGEIIYVDSDGSLRFPDAPNYRGPTGEARELLAQGHELVYEETGEAADPQLQQQKETEAQLAGADLPSDGSESAQSGQVPPEADNPVTPDETPPQEAPSKKKRS